MATPVRFTVSEDRTVTLDLYGGRPRGPGDGIQSIDFELINNYGTDGRITLSHITLQTLAAGQRREIPISWVDLAGVRHDGVVTAIGTNDRPVFQTNTAVTASKDAAAGTVVGTFTAFDVDEGAVVRYSLHDNAGGRFAIDAVTGDISIADPALLAGDVGGKVRIVVKATDELGGAFVKTVTMYVNPTLYGTIGNDTIRVANGTGFTVEAGAGDDRIFDGFGKDTLVGGTGNDSYYIRNYHDRVVELAGEGFDTVTTASEGYTLDDNVEVLRLAANVATARGNAGNNMLYGNAGGNELTGGAGSDTIFGGGEQDYLYGEAGNDVIHGETGGDRMYGGDGNDVLHGGAGSNGYWGEGGADRFVVTQTEAADYEADFIGDFSAAEGDVIDLSGIDANGAATGEGKFAFVGAQAFSGTAGELRLETFADGYALHGDVNGDKIADVTVYIVADAPPQAADLIL